MLFMLKVMVYMVTMYTFNKLWVNPNSQVKLNTLTLAFTLILILTITPTPMLILYNNSYYTMA